MSSRKGARRERELRNYFREMDGYTPLRMPSSGSAIDQDLPDLLVGVTDMRPLAIELKSGAGSRFYVTAEECRALRRFADRFSARPYLAGRWDGDTTYYLVPLESAPRTEESANARLKQETAQEHWWAIERPEGV